MKQLILPAMLIALTACAQPAPTPAPAPEPAPTPVSEPAAPPTVTLASMAGKWALTNEGCADTNVTGDGVLEITATTVKSGLDLCTLTTEVPMDAGILVTAQCAGGEGEAYERHFQFVSSTPATLTWVGEGGGAEPYIRCP